MTVSEAHIAFKIEADKNAVNIGMSGCPSFLPEEIDYWLYTAYLSKIATKFTGNNTLKSPFESTIKRLADLEGLVRTDKGITLLSETESNRLTMNNFKSSITYGSDTQDKRMYFINGVLHFSNNKLIVYVDRDLMIGPYTIDITYLAYPRKINNKDITSTLDEIPEYMQYEVVKLAADMALENVESVRSQTHPQHVAQYSE